MAANPANPRNRPIRTTDALARHLGLSRWTVSRVLNGHPGVRKETVDRVREAMVALGFAPNPMARGLRGSRTMMVGVCFQELETPILVRKTMALQNGLRDRGYQAIIELTGKRTDLEAGIIRNFRSLRVDGIVLVGSTLSGDDPAVGELAQSGLPVVAVDPEGDLPFPTVRVNREAVYPLAIEHLHALGHRRFGFLGFAPGVTYARQRLAGIRNCLARLGLEAKRDCLFVSGGRRKDLFYTGGYALGGEFLEKADPIRPTAVVALNDQIALGALRRWREAGLELPRDLSLTGFDNLDVCGYATPSLTTVDQEVATLMGLARDTLLALIRGEPAPPLRQEVSPRLVVRESTAAPGR